MTIPSAAFIRNDPKLPHFRDDRRPVGRFTVGGREDGTGYAAQTVQHPVICADDIVERSPSNGRESDYVTDDPRRVRCKDCRQRLGV
jgi:hypothetical protein